MTHFLTLDKLFRNITLYFPVISYQPIFPPFKDLGPYSARKQKTHLRGKRNKKGPIFVKTRSKFYTSCQSHKIWLICNKISELLQLYFFLNQVSLWVSGWKFTYVTKTSYKDTSTGTKNTRMRDKEMKRMFVTAVCLLSYAGDNCVSQTGTIINLTNFRVI